MHPFDSTTRQPSWLKKNLQRRHWICQKRGQTNAGCVLFYLFIEVTCYWMLPVKKQNDAISLLSIWGVYLGIFYHMALETLKPKSNDMYRNVGAWEDLDISVRSDKNSTMPKFWKGFPFTYPCFFVHSLMWMYAFTYVWQAIFFFLTVLLKPRIY